MKEILFGTTNEAKIKQFQGALAPIGVSVRGVEDKASLPPVEEDGATAQENARKKAMAYAKAFNIAVLSMDNALYFDKLSSEEQPGLNVRRISTMTTRPSDEELLGHYSALVRKLGETTTGRWEFAICIATPEGKFKETTITSPRVFTSIPSRNIVPDYPLESIQVDSTTGKYISEMNQEEQNDFWQKTIGKPLQDFISKIDL